MKAILFICFILLLSSCTKNNKNDNQSFYYIEDFRKPGMDDYQTIIAACDSLPENSKIQFASKTYLLSHTPIIQKSFKFYGPATFKRENQIAYILKEPADEFSKYLILSSTKGLIAYDRIEVCINKDITGATPINVATQINGDTVLLDAPLGSTFGGENVYSAGTKVFKSINFFWILSPTKYTDMSCSFDNLTFDGNRDNNAGTYFWNINASVTAISSGTTYYRNCKFINSPNETIVGHNADIRNCVFYDLNGSGFHTSADKFYCSEDEIHSYLINNSFENTNQISSTITGHSEGAITHSQCGGYYIATGNSFKNVGESVLGALYPSVSVRDWGTSNITFTGNTINGARKMVYTIDTTFTGTLHDVRIESNIISNMPSLDWSSDLAYWPRIILKDKSGE